jgi:hypothetical protein
MVKGVYSNILDEHPLNAVWKVKNETETAVKH